MAIANTTIQVRKSGTTGVKPTSLANGELAINYADNKLYYKDGNGNISHFYGANNGPGFATANANNTLVLATLPNDTLSITPGNNISISACTSTKAITFNVPSLDNAPVGSTTPSTGAFTTMSVQNATVATKATGINAWNYAGKNKSVTSQDTAPTGVFFSSDGTKMYVIGSTTDNVFQYNLGTAWDVTTAVFTTGDNFSVTAQDAIPTDIYFKPDGTAFYMVGDTNNTIYQYSIATPWVINTSSYASKSFSVASQDTIPTGLWFKPDGTTMYVVGYGSDALYQYSLGTAWDVSTASLVTSFSIAGQESVATGLVFNPTGTSFYIVGSSSDNIVQYNLGTAWDISTSTFFSNYYVGFIEGTTNGLFIDFNADNRIYFVGSANDTVYQLNSNTNTVNFTSDRINLLANTSVGNNLTVTGSIATNGALTAYGALTIGGSTTLSTTGIGGTLTSSAAVNFSTTTSNISLGTSQTTGLLTAGGASQTGTITLGQSTVSQITNIQAGATASGSTKTINIGTAGLSGSITNINIGSAVAGSTGTTTISSPLTVANTITFGDGTKQNTAAAPFVFSNSAYDAANSGASFANAAFTTANSASSNTVTTQGVDVTQNTNITIAQSFANGAFTVANSAAVFANAAFTTANSGASFANAAFTTANSGASFANAAFVTANSGASFANSAYAYANGLNIIANTLTTTTTTANQVALSYATATYRSAKVFAQITSGSAYQCTEILILHDGTNAFMTQYGDIYTSASLGTFDSQISTGNLQLLFTPVNAASTVKLSTRLLPV